jgi:prevent-host-death family protein
MTQVGMHQAKTQLSKLVERALAGEEVVIARNGTPVIQLVPVAKPKSRRDVIGSLRGQIWMADDFDEFDDELAEMFGMK